MCVDCWEHFERDSNTWPVVVRCRHATWPRPRKIWERWPLSCNKERRQSGTRHFFCVPASSRKNCQVEWLLAVSVSPSPLSLQHKNRKVGQLTPPPPPPTHPPYQPHLQELTIESPFWPISISQISALYSTQDLKKKIAPCWRLEVSLSALRFLQYCTLILPAGPQDHCGRFRIQTRELCPQKSGALPIFLTVLWVFYLRMRTGRM